MLIATGTIAPDFSLEDLSGTVVSLADFRGRIVLVNFWSAECPQSARADAALLDWQDRVVLLWIASNANEPPDLLEREAERRGLPLVLRDPTQRVARLYSAETTPHFFLIDPVGILRYQGALDDVTFRRRAPERFYVMEAMQSVRSGQPVAVAETPPYGCTIVFAYG